MSTVSQEFAEQIKKMLDVGPNEDERFGSTDPPYEGQGVLDDLTPFETNHIDGCEVCRFEPDPSEYEIESLSNLLGFQAPIYTEFELKIVFPRLMKWIQMGNGPRNLYCNPGIRVTSEEPDIRFLELVQREQKRWRNRMKDTIGHKFVMPALDAKIRTFQRQLVVSGVLVFYGKHIFPDQFSKLIERVRSSQ